jgi:CheY-like chemotaxis protein
MVYGFTQQSGGHVTIESEEGHGTTVALYLPQAEAAGEDAQPEAAGEVKPRGHGETILVVEDEPDLRQVTVRQLEGLGYKTLQAPDGPVALDVLADSPEIDLLLSDVMLPGGMNGRELATEIERHAPGIKVLYMSGYTEDAIAHHGRLDADAELLKKPFRRDALARAVRRVLDRSSA